MIEVELCGMMILLLVKVSQFPSACQTRFAQLSVLFPPTEFNLIKFHFSSN